MEAREELPAGENSFVRWELADLGGETVLARSTGSGFAASWHAFLDRMQALLGGRPLPDWMQRFTQLRGDYPAWVKWARGSPAVQPT